MVGLYWDYKETEMEMGKGQVEIARRGGGWVEGGDRKGMERCAWR